MVATFICIGSGVGVEASLCVHSTERLSTGRSGFSGIRLVERPNRATVVWQLRDTAHESLSKPHRELGQ